MNGNTHRAHDVLQQVAPSPVCVLEWGSAGECRRTFLSTVDDLHAQLDAGQPEAQQAQPRAQAQTREQPPQPQTQKAQQAQQAQPQTRASSSPNRLFVVHGLPDKFLMAISSSMEIDPAFIEAHAQRGRYSPLRWRKEARFAHYVYPELVREIGKEDGGDAKDSTENEKEKEKGKGKGKGKEKEKEKGKGKETTGNAAGGAGGEGAETAQLSGITDKLAVWRMGGTTAAVFCRASLWFSAQGNLLFLERPVWRDPASSLRKARRESSVTKPYALRPPGADNGNGGGDGGGGGNIIDPKTPVSRARDVVLAEGNEIRSLEDVLFEMLKDAEESDGCLADMLAQIAYNQWLEFFQALQLPLQNPLEDTAKLYWQALHYLHQNDRAAAALLSPHNRPDWKALLTLMQQCIALLNSIASSLPRPHRCPLPPPPSPPFHPALTRASPLSRPPSSRKPSSRKPNRQAMISSAMWRKANPATVKPGGGSGSGSGGGGGDGLTKNQRALDRISFLGGMLIPLPIISGVLSMNDRYLPGGGFFYVFWAWSIPLSAATVLIIYVDIIRQVELWAEIGAEHVIAATAAVDEAEAEAEIEAAVSDVVGALPVPEVQGGATLREEEMQKQKKKKSVTWNRTTAPPLTNDGASQQPPGESSVSPSPSPRPQPRIVEAKTYNSIGQEEKLIGMTREEAAAGFSEPSEDEEEDESSTSDDNEPSTSDDNEPSGSLPLPATGATGAMSLPPLPARTYSYANSYVSEGPFLILEQPADGSQPRKAWRRQQLGWYGAMRSLVGMQRTRRLEDVPVGVLAYERERGLQQPQRRGNSGGGGVLNRGATPDPDEDAGVARRKTVTV